ncbi:phosphoribosylanthranilate isomerase [Aestuariivivens sediminis]|uniref:phosphoribosylanthranilate isomerase n=1 Tax=Aestuariivivens sediminis TaxID=2913557 RepID=UPI001F5A27C3|nr:phosphoribosylanthranilate isomerase [Aestuariivivens sediminis]
MKLKICGMKYEVNIEDVASLQPDYLGFIFYEKSARYFDREIPKLPSSIKKVGVFVDPNLDFVIETINKHDLQAVQLHGNESPAFCEQLKLYGQSEETAFTADRDSQIIKTHTQLNRVQDDHQIEIIKVFSIKDEFNFEVLYPYETVCDYYLFDTKGKLPGGNGYTFNWNVLTQYPSHKPFFLSGGIGLNEVPSVLSFLSKKESKYCYAIDVNSKFEIEPGLKNLEFLKEFKNNIIN